MKHEKRKTLESEQHYSGVICANVPVATDPIV